MKGNDISKRNICSKITLKESHLFRFASFFLANIVILVLYIIAVTWRITDRTLMEVIIMTRVHNSKLKSR